MGYFVFAVFVVVVVAVVAVVVVGDVVVFVCVAWNSISKLVS